MRLSRPLTVLGLAALSLLLGDLADAAPKKAKVKGGFDVADAQNDGKLKGVVQTAGGTVVFLLEANLKDATPAGANGVAGTI
ncbi:MAG: hypothetical protein ACF8XB_08270, partial [Planctomycetota bacterium JB042]